jgi:hypothetical protein
MSGYWPDGCTEVSNMEGWGEEPPEQEEEEDHEYQKWQYDEIRLDDVLSVPVGFMVCRVREDQHEDEVEDEAKDRACRTANGH